MPGGLPNCRAQAADTTFDWEFKGYRKVAMRNRYSTQTLMLSAFFVVGCETPVDPGMVEVANETVEISRPANAELGRVAFKEECASCHAAGDGFDLAVFSFPDSTIIRRALGHVNELAANDIVAHIRTIQLENSTIFGPSKKVSRFDRILQPGDRRLQGDVDFARTLFGEDVWPSELTPAQLRAIDLTDVAVALNFPRWSSEDSNLDWMPDTPLSEGITSYRPSNSGSKYSIYRVGATLDTYYKYKTDHALRNVVESIRIAERSSANPEAPCLVQFSTLFRPEECFETRRWTASLIAQHMVRRGQSDQLESFLHNLWWDVGNAARKSISHGKPIANATENWAMWMHMGWTFAPEMNNSFYLGEGLRRLGLRRHATFVALRSMVVRSDGSHLAYRDLRNVLSFAPDHWAAEALEFGYKYLIDQLEQGKLPRRRYDLEVAYEKLISTQRKLASRKLWSAQYLVRPLHERVLELLPEL